MISAILPAFPLPPFPHDTLPYRDIFPVYFALILSPYYRCRKPATTHVNLTSQFIIYRGRTSSFLLASTCHASTHKVSPVFNYFSSVPSAVTDGESIANFTYLLSTREFPPKHISRLIPQHPPKPASMSLPRNSIFYWIVFSRNVSARPCVYSCCCVRKPPRN